MFYNVRNLPFAGHSALSDAFQRRELQPSDLGNSLRVTRTIRWAKYGDFEMKIRMIRSAVFASNKAQKCQLQPFTATGLAAKMEEQMKSSKCCWSVVLA